MEELYVEFETKAEDDERFKCFLVDVKERLDTMAAFKRTYLKFKLSVDIALQKVVVCVVCFVCVFFLLLSLDFSFFYMYIYS